MKYNELAVRSGVVPSAVYSMMTPNLKCRDVSIITIKILCDGLEIFLEEFFSGPEFKRLDQEIQRGPLFLDRFQAPCYHKSL